MRSKHLMIAGLVCGALLLAIAARIIATPPSAQSPSASASISSLYLLSAVGACRGPVGYVPCFGGNVSQAEIFNCANAAASTTGCTQLVASTVNSTISYRITIWYPSLAHENGPSWVNGVYESSGDPGQQYFVKCILTNATAFIVSEPAPPPS